MHADVDAHERNSLSASALHARLQAATRAARHAANRTRRSQPLRARRIAEAEAWAFLQEVGGSITLADPSLSVNRAVRRIAAALLEDARDATSAFHVAETKGPVLIIRSGPWPVLSSLVTRIASVPGARPVTVLCHTRDATQLGALGETAGLPLEPLLYPRFEPFNTTTLRRLVGAREWTTTFVLDASKTGQGQSLEHVTTALDPGRVHVWNASGQAWTLQPLRARLGNERYALLRRLLRWRAQHAEP